MYLELMFYGFLNKNISSYLKLQRRTHIHTHINIQITVYKIYEISEANPALQDYMF
jgi:hypothetical protein